MQVESPPVVERRPAGEIDDSDEVQSGRYYLERLRDGTFWQRLTARAKLAGIFERRQMLEEAADCYQAIIRAGIRSPDLHQRLAIVYRRLGEHDLADSTLAALDKPAPRTKAPDGHHGRGASADLQDEEILRLAESLELLARKRAVRASTRQQAKAAAGLDFQQWLTSKHAEPSDPRADGADQRARRQVPWSDVEDRYILERSGEPARLVATALGRSVQSIYRRRSELRRDGRPSLTLESAAVDPTHPPPLGFPLKLEDQPNP